MDKETKILSQKILYKGRNQVCEYALQVASLHPDKNSARVMKREVVHFSDSVVVLIYAPQIDSFVLCKEFRPGVFLNTGDDDPFIWECVAGMIDKNKSPEEIARIEVREEAELEAGILTNIAIAYSSPGQMTEKTYVYYTEIEGIPQSGLFGLAHEGEEITTHIIKRDDVYNMMDEMKIIDAHTLLALNWFRAKHG